MASDDLNFETKAADIIGLYLHLRNMQPSSASMKSRPFKRWTGLIQCCRFRRAESKCMASSITVMARYPCMPRWM